VPNTRVDPTSPKPDPGGPFVKTIYSPDHRLRAPKTELSGGELVRPFECPERAEIVKAAITRVGLGPILPPDTHPREMLLGLHDPDYIAFLKTAWEEWRAAGYEGEAIPSVWPARRMTARCPSEIEGKLGFYAFAAETSISEGTWQAALASADVAMTAATCVAQGDGQAFALCRPPGHHAGRDLYGGYCFLNNAGLAAQVLRDSGAERVAVLDVDFHHGNGTQDIFYARDDVLFISIHGAPEEAFPHYMGYADEIGTGAGDGHTLNLPLPRGTDWAGYAAALETACQKIARAGAEALVVSLGVDIFERDPISFFKLSSEDFVRLGARLGQIGLPTVYVLEGGYAVDEIGQNVANTLMGHEGAAAQR
jgi:acetoin utilization deacetylase AcuC-like enzyme